MESEVHQVLGDIKIQEICECYRLNDFAKYIIDITLVKWDGLVGNKEEKIKVFEEEAGCHPEKEKLAMALRDICRLFATTKTGYWISPTDLFKRRLECYLEV